MEEAIGDMLVERSYRQKREVTVGLRAALRALQPDLQRTGQTKLHFHFSPK